MAKTRTFIGIAIDAETISAATTLAKRVRPLAGDLRWVPEENLHITLQFLGDLTDTEVVEVCSTVARAAEAFDPFAIEIASLGAFPSNDRPRTLWVGIAEDEGRQQLIDLQSATEEALATLGYRGENRRYVPHITIGKSGRSPGGKNDALTAELEKPSESTGAKSLVAEVTVYASELLREGPEYHVLARCPLG